MGSLHTELGSMFHVKPFRPLLGAGRACSAIYVGVSLVRIDVRRSSRILPGGCSLHRIRSGKSGATLTRYVNPELNTLLTTLYVLLTDRVLPDLGVSRDRRPGRKPGLSNA